MFKKCFILLILLSIPVIPVYAEEYYDDTERFDEQWNEPYDSVYPETNPYRDTQNQQYQRQAYPSYNSYQQQNHSQQTDYPLYNTNNGQSTQSQEKNYTQHNTTEEQTPPKLRGDDSPYNSYSRQNAQQQTNSYPQYNPYEPQNIQRYREENSLYNNYQQNENYSDFDIYGQQNTRQNTNQTRQNTQQHQEEYPAYNNYQQNENYSGFDIYGQQNTRQNTQQYTNQQPATQNRQNYNSQYYGEYELNENGSPEFVYPSPQKTQSPYAPDRKEQQNGVTISSPKTSDDYVKIYNELKPADFSYMHDIDPDQYYDIKDTTWAPYPLLRLNSYIYFKDRAIEPGYYLITPREYKGNWYMLFKQNGKVAHIIPVYKRELVPEGFYDSHLPKPKLTPSQKMHMGFLSFLGKFDSSKRRDPVQSYMEINDLENYFVSIVIYYGPRKYSTIFRTIKL